MSETVSGARCTNYYTDGAFVFFFYIMYSLAFMLVRYKEARGRTDSS